MYKIIIMGADESQDIVLFTDKRALARAAVLLCNENNLVCEVVREVKVIPVKFKGIGDEKKADVTPAPKSVIKASKSKS